MEIKYFRWFKNGLSLGGVFVMTFLLGFESYAFAIAQSQNRSSLSKNYGNFERIINSLSKKEPNESFSFAVVSDIAETCTFERLCNKLRNEELSFMVVLGGFVLTREKSSYNYFNHACIYQYRLPFPVFLIASDHDIVYGEMDFDIGDVTLTDFSNMYGPPNFSFEYGGCLFIGLCLLPSPYPINRSLEFLDSTLAKYSDRNRKVFVFAHKLSTLSTGSTTDRHEENQALEDIVSRYKVDYIVTSHDDDYVKKEKEGTTYLVSTLGKSVKHWEGEKALRDLRRALVLTVNPGSVSEKCVFIQHCVEPRVRLFAMAKLSPYLKRHPAATIAENILVFGMFCVFLHNLIKKRS